MISLKRGPVPRLAPSLVLGVDLTIWLILHDTLALEIVVQVGQVLSNILIFALLFEDLAVAASDEDGRVVL